jgi:predicted N-acyltransferase
MPESADTTVLEVVSDITQVSAEAWNACAGADDPFVRHAFLKALETSGSAVAKRGWLPQHLILRADDGGLLGAVPLYLKGHSYGEYVFDWAWADAYERAGGAYYPKLQSAVPFTPVTGPRLLTRRDLPPREQARITDILVAGLIRAVQEHDASSLHVTFPLESEWNRLGEHGFQRRLGIQYHFENPGYRDFGDFLDALNSRKRKQIRRERREVAESGVTIRRLTGADIQPRHWEAFYDFYLATADKRWGFPYLTPEFFEEIGEAMAERILLVMAEDAAGRPVAGALNLIGSEALYGRNWGCLDDHRFLHFEACYYQAIEYAIEAGLKRVEAGAQGEHKIQRGYLPVLTRSAHWIADPALERGVADFLERERPAVRAQLAALMEHSPYRTPDHGQG